MKRSRRGGNAHDAAAAQIRHRGGGEGIDYRGGQVAVHRPAQPVRGHPGAGGGDRDDNLRAQVPRHSAHARGRGVSGLCAPGGAAGRADRGEVHRAPGGTPALFRLYAALLVHLQRVHRAGARAQRPGVRIHPARGQDLRHDHGRPEPAQRDGRDLHERVQRGRHQQDAARGESGLFRALRGPAAHLRGPQQSALGQDERLHG